MLDLLVCLAACGPQSPIQLPQIQNGSFQDAVAGVASTSWCGAEGKVLTEGSVSYVSLGTNDRAFQGVAKAHAQTPDLDLAIKVRLPLSSTVGRVTISEASEQFEALTHQLASPDDPLIAAPWSAYENVGGWQPMVFDDVGPSHYGFTGTAPGNQTINLYGLWFTGEVQLEFDVPVAGDVVWMERPVLYGGPGTIRVEVFKDSDGTLGPAAPTLLRSYDLTAAQPHGADLTGDVTVTASDTLLFRFKNLDPQQTFTKVMCRPAVRYTSSRVTYVMATSPPTLPVLGGEHVELVTGLPVGSWSAVPLPFEADFASAFGRAPKAPFLVELRNYGVRPVHFTDVTCTHTRTIEDYATLRADVLAEAERVVAVYQASAAGHLYGVRDDINTPTRWQVYVMDPVDGPEFTNPDPTLRRYGSVPSNLRRLLNVRFSEAEYEDLAGIVWSMFSPANRVTSTGAPAALWFAAYECKGDVFDKSVATTDLNAGALALELYRHTGDVKLLEAARDYALVAAQNGVVTDASDVRMGLVLGGGYDVTTGANSAAANPSTDDLLAHGTLDGACFLAEVVGELLAYDQANPGKISLTALPTIKAVAVSAIDRANFLRIVDVAGNTHYDWVAPWWSIAYAYSDVYGYTGIAAIPALNTISTFAASDPDVAAMRADLLDFLGDGANAFLEPWQLNTARNAPNAGDQSRAWEPLLWLLQNDLSLIDEVRTREQLVRVARRYAAYQMPEGVWVNANEDEFYLEDIAASGGTPLHAPLFLDGFATVLAADPTNTALRDELLTRARDVFRATLDWFVLASQPGYKQTYWGNSVFKMTETRVVDSFLGMLTKLDRLYQVGQGAAKPVVAITPLDYATVPAGPQEFFFTVTAPPGDDLSAMLAQRTRVRQHVLSGGIWTPGNDLWPNAGSAGTWSIAPGAGNSVTLRFTPATALSGEFKFEIVTWTPDGRWDTAMTYQNW